MLALGTPVKGGFAADWPGCIPSKLVPPSPPSNVSQGNLQVPTDYRSVYMAVLREWLGGDDPREPDRRRGGRSPASRRRADAGCSSDVSWFAILLALASLGGAPSGAVRKQCAKAAVSTAAEAALQDHGQEEDRRAEADEAGGQDQADARTDSRRRRARRARRTRPRATAATPRPRRPRRRRRGATPTPVPTATPTRPGHVPVAHRRRPRASGSCARPTARSRPAGSMFNAANLGRGRSQPVRARRARRNTASVELAPGDTGSLVLQLSPGTYTLYCSLLGHEEQGMRTDISVR